MTASKRVLVIDDESTREALQIILESEGCEVLLAEHGQAGLTEIASYTPDVILLDMRMPVMDGRAFTDAYHRLPGPHAPIIVITAAADAARSATEVGAACCVPKPFGISELLEALEQADRWAWLRRALSSRSLPDR